MHIHTIRTHCRRTIFPFLQLSSKRPRPTPQHLHLSPKPFPQHSRFIHTQTPPKPSRYTAGDRLGAAICVLVSGGTFGLGIWQTKRYYWKVDRVTTRQARVEQRPMALLEAAALSNDEAAYRRVFCEGEFVADGDVLLGPRATPAATGGLNQSGFFVYTPMRLDDGTEVVVNRGWVPKQAVVDGKVDGSFAAPVGRIKVEGVVAVGESGGGFTPVNDLSKRRLLWLDLEALRELCKAAPTAIVVDEVGSGSKGRNGPVMKTLDNFMQFKVNPYTHIGYAATWYSLSAVALAFVRLRFLK